MAKLFFSNCNLVLVKVSVVLLILLLDVRFSSTSRLRRHADLGEANDLDARPFVVHHHPLFGDVVGPPELALDAAVPHKGALRAPLELLHGYEKPGLHGKAIFSGRKDLGSTYNALLQLDDPLPRSDNEFYSVTGLGLGRWMSPGNIVFLPKTQGPKQPETQTPIGQPRKANSISVTPIGRSFFPTQAHRPGNLKKPAAKAGTSKTSAPRAPETSKTPATTTTKFTVPPPGVTLETGSSTITILPHFEGSVSTTPYVYENFTFTTEKVIGEADNRTIKPDNPLGKWTIPPPGQMWNPKDFENWLKKTPMSIVGPLFPNTQAPWNPGPMFAKPREQWPMPWQLNTYKFNKPMFPNTPAPWNPGQLGSIEPGHQPPKPNVVPFLTPGSARVRLVNVTVSLQPISSCNFNFSTPKGAKGPQCYATPPRKQPSSKTTQSTTKAASKLISRGPRASEVTYQALVPSRPRKPAPKDALSTKRDADRLSSMIAGVWSRDLHDQPQKNEHQENSLKTLPYFEKPLNFLTLVMDEQDGSQTLPQGDIQALATISIKDVYSNQNKTPMNEHIDKKSAENQKDTAGDDLMGFFTNMAKTVKLFPFEEQVKIKSALFKSIAEAEQRNDIDSIIQYENSTLPNSNDASVKEYSNKTLEKASAKNVTSGLKHLIKNLASAVHWMVSGVHLEPGMNNKQAPKIAIQNSLLHTKLSNITSVIPLKYKSSEKPRVTSLPANILPKITTSFDAQDSHNKSLATTSKGGPLETQLSQVNATSPNLLSMALNLLYAHLLRRYSNSTTVKKLESYVPVLTNESQKHQVASTLDTIYSKVLKKENDYLSKPNTHYVPLLNKRNKKPILREEVNTDSENETLTRRHLLKIPENATDLVKVKTNFTEEQSAYNSALQKYVLVENVAYDKTGAASLEDTQQTTSNLNANEPQKFNIDVFKAPDLKETSRRIEDQFSVNTTIIFDPQILGNLTIEKELVINIAPQVNYERESVKNETTDQLLIHNEDTLNNISKVSSEDQLIANVVPKMPSNSLLVRNVSNENDTERNEISYNIARYVIPYININDSLRYNATAEKQKFSQLNIKKVSDNGAVIQQLEHISHTHLDPQLVNKTQASNITEEIQPLENISKILSKPQSNIMQVGNEAEEKQSLVNTQIHLDPQLNITEATDIATNMQRLDNISQMYLEPPSVNTTQTSIIDEEIQPLAKSQMYLDHQLVNITTSSSVVARIQQLANISQTLLDPQWNLTQVSNIAAEIQQLANISQIHLDPQLNITQLRNMAADIQQLANISQIHLDPQLQNITQASDLDPQLNITQLRNMAAEIQQLANISQIHLDPQLQNTTQASDLDLQLNITQLRNMAAEIQQLANTSQIHLDPQLQNITLASDLDPQLNITQFINMPADIQQLANISQIHLDPKLEDILQASNIAKNIQPLANISQIHLDPKLEDIPQASNIATNIQPPANISQIHLDPKLEDIPQASNITTDIQPPANISQIHLDPKLEDILQASNIATDIQPLANISQIHLDPKLEDIPQASNIATDVQPSNISQIHLDPQLENITQASNIVTDIQPLANISEIPLDPQFNITEASNIAADMQKLANISQSEDIPQASNTDIQLLANISQIHLGPQAENITQSGDLAAEIQQLVNISQIHLDPQLENITQASDLDPQVNITQLNNMAVEIQQQANISQIHFDPQLQDIPQVSNIATDIQPLANISQIHLDPLLENITQASDLVAETRPQINISQINLVPQLVNVLQESDKDAEILQLANISQVHLEPPKAADIQPLMNITQAHLDPQTVNIIQEKQTVNDKFFLNSIPMVNSGFQMQNVSTNKQFIKTSGIVFDSQLEENGINNKETVMNVEPHVNSNIQLGGKIMTNNEALNTGPKRQEDQVLPERRSEDGNSITMKSKPGDPLSMDDILSFLML